MEKSKQIGQLNQALGDPANASRVEGTVAGGCMSASRTIQSRIKARRCAAILVVRWATEATRVEEFLSGNLRSFFLLI